jgi:hypothetical protein
VSGPDRRTVRTTLQFFEDLDPQLPAERTGDTPSRSDFQAYDLLEIVERLCHQVRGSARVDPRPPHYRVLITHGRVVPAISVIGQLAPDGAVELVGIDLDAAIDW